jgi:hypothetical protein
MNTNNQVQVNPPRPSVPMILDTPAPPNPQHNVRATMSQQHVTFAPSRTL